MREEQKIRGLVMDGMWAALLFITGLFKIPSFIPGTEFQLSAPLAVCIGRVRGFTRYLMIGIVVSIIGMLLGLQNILNVTVAMVYRIVAGLILTIWKKDPWALIISGPAGTLAARLVLAAVLHTSCVPLIIAAVPGMIFTAITAPLFTHLVKKRLGTVGPVGTGI